MPPPAHPEISPQPLWTVPLTGKPRGLSFARECNWLLTWDENNWLTILDRKGQPQANRRFEATVTAAACADDGSAALAVGAGGDVHWLAPDLAARWEQSLPAGAVACAIDPHGRYGAIADLRGTLHLVDRFGRPVAQATVPRPLHHLAFVPEAATIIGAADFGLVVASDLSGRLLWQDRVVANFGSLAVNGDGSRMVLACFSEGLRFYTRAGQKEKTVPLPEPVQQAALSYDGKLLLAGALGKKLHLIETASGKVTATLSLERPAVALALDALARRAAVALSDGRVMGLEMRPFTKR